MLPERLEIRAEPVHPCPKLRQLGPLRAYLGLESRASRQPEGRSEEEATDDGARPRPTGGDESRHEPASAMRRVAPAAIRRSRARLPSDIPYVRIQ